MTDKQFWQMIEAAREEAPDNVKRRFKAIRSKLMEMDASEIVGFENCLRKQLRRAYTFDLMAAAFLVMSYISDDTFEDFRAWLVAQGRERFEKAIKTPESITEFLTRAEARKVAGEGLLLAACEVYEKKTGLDDFDDKVKDVSDPDVKQDWPKTREALRKRYPVLFDAFWNEKRVRELHP